MLPIESRLNDLLNETRLAMLGAQILLGLQYLAAFSRGFARVPTAFQILDCVALLLILITANLPLAAPAFHQIAEHGRATTRMIGYGSTALQLALLPLSIALAIDVSLGLISHAGELGAALGGSVFAVGAWSVWYALPLLSATRSRRKERPMEEKQQSLEARIAQALTELRVILPGAQALFGFQMSAVLTDSFDRLNAESQVVHLASLMIIAVAIVLLIAPAAYHRIAAGGDADVAVLNYIVRMMLLAEGLIALGLMGGAFVTILMVSGSQALAIASSVAVFAGFIVLLYVVPLMARRSRKGSIGVSAITSA